MRAITDHFSSKEYKVLSQDFRYLWKWIFSPLLNIAAMSVKSPRLDGDEFGPAVYIQAKLTGATLRSQCDKEVSKKIGAAQPNHSSTSLSFESDPEKGLVIVPNLGA